MSSAKFRPFSLGLNVLTNINWTNIECWEWITNNVDKKLGDAITHPCAFNSADEAKSSVSKFIQQKNMNAITDSCLNLS